MRITIAFSVAVCWILRSKGTAAGSDTVLGLSEGLGFTCSACFFFFGLFFLVVLLSSLFVCNTMRGGLTSTETFTSESSCLSCQVLNLVSEVFYCAHWSVVPELLVNVCYIIHHRTRLSGSDQHGVLSARRHCTYEPCGCRLPVSRFQIGKLWSLR